MTEEKPCRHEYVRIFQRKLKGLERRMVCTRAFLPIGFKLGDFGHLSEGSFCFCAKCRMRLFPKRTQGEKNLARLANLAGKASAALLAESELNDELLEDEIQVAQSGAEQDDEAGPKIDIHVEELEPEMVDVQDITAEGVKLNDEEESCALSEEEM
jgi:hypothetical protein